MALPKVTQLIKGTANTEEEKPQVGHYTALPECYLI